MRSRDITQQSQKRRASGPIAPFCALLVGLVAVIVLIRRGYIPYNQRALNKRFLNPVMLRFAGSTYSPQAVIYHSGRKSGRAYATPIVVEPITGGFIIPLPYGTDVDWCRNICAAGHCAIRWHGTTYAAVGPEVLDAPAATTVLSPLRQRMFHMLGVKHVLKLQIAPTPTPSVTTAW
jgi:hypothetical protein